ncbi:cobalt-precorrin-6A reductase [Hoeflea poritis]|uniref:Cobalt-precorrin-6A reductase n=1 Tax=Hoeflea poritis TaxID=2993659 RepID=A0ABT4VIZ4_9HYPH|nr:cobalt-precorrin-6A reductase [Hoeflea poritis]MDA4844663.1 cobalt-precorrin-6A reductase [Hoeflea poritis]
MPVTPESILILGGTKEAAELAGRLTELGVSRVVTSLAGRTAAPEMPAGETRIGGFGGAQGLADFLRSEAFELLVDATHPFADTISHNAVEAAVISGIPLMTLRRPAWTAVDGDHWFPVASVDEACTAIPPSARVFLALGRQHIDGFAQRTDVHFIARMVDPPERPLPFRSCDLVIGKPSADPGTEAELLRTYGVTHIVCRNSGGQGAYAKLIAARDLGLPVIMIERPDTPDDRSYPTVDALLADIT